MKRLALFALFLFVPVSHALATGVVHVANGDCAGLSAAANAAPGHEPSLIVLARNGDYNCQIDVAGTIAIDGSGSKWEMQTPFGTTCQPPSPGTQLAVSGNLTLRNFNFVPAASASTSSSKSTKSTTPKPEFCNWIFGPVIGNSGTLVIDSSSIRDPGRIENSGSLTLSNVTLTNPTSHGAWTVIDFLPGSSGSSWEPSSITITNSTLDAGESASLIVEGLADGFGSTISVANSILVGSSASLCNFSSSVNVSSTSQGGNLFKDTSCGFNAASDRVVSDAGFADLGHHGGVVDTLALSSSSPAIGNGLAANCAATDARGAARGQTHCDSGAYEFGGGQGKLAVSGTTGLYFNHANNGHYVTVQRVFDNNALVIWNTFDENGKPAWVYGVGAINGGSIHVEQVAENLGGILQPGGAVSGVTPTLWGTFDLDVSSCYTATLNYHSVLPQFGNGTVHLERLAFVTGLDCSQ